MAKTLFLLLGITLLLLPLTVFVNSGIAKADTSYPYPGPWEYEEDVVTVACGQIHPVEGNINATLEKMEKMIIEAAEQGANMVVFGEMVLMGCNYRENPECSYKDFQKLFLVLPAWRLLSLPRNTAYGLFMGSVKKVRTNPTLLKYTTPLQLLGRKELLAHIARFIPDL